MMKYKEGHIYQGQWDNNKKHGLGMFKYSRGHVYEGDWRGE